MMILCCDIRCASDESVKTAYMNDSVIIIAITITKSDNRIEWCLKREHILPGVPEGPG